MKLQMVAWVVGMLMDRVDEDMVEGWIAKALDMIEEKVLDSPTKLDDLTVLPMIKLAREVFDIGEDNEV